eukprot:CAMPEP_0197587422 /NCGR_PEP_ID=MMETSP1326-20131121/9062_1 /TAXON_ID=1155430 /ORGANISM="Genus nov. species nov., Strain RCC2288" /LENGTH=138 /DNA_ID=CAMNT_0043152153 /DNA_START=15 /DNA_END=427 /DNA_ORIENTATION=-
MSPSSNRPQDPTTPKSHGKPHHHKNKPQATFIAVIDALVAAVLAYPPPPPKVTSEAAADDAMDATEAAPPAAAAATAAAAAGPKLPVAPSLAAVRASLALRLLTDFTLVYSAAAGQILRRDAEGGLLRHVLYVQLPAA